MADDPYALLGVTKAASAEDIRAAYRKLAKQHHPDLNPGNKAAEEMFKKISAANELLSDAQTRARYDQGEIDETGAQTAPPPGYRHYAEAKAGERYAYESRAGSGFGPGNFEDMFADMFEPRGQGAAAGRDAHYALPVPFLDAVNGATQRLNLPDGQVLDVKIPPGTSGGDMLRLRGRGQAGRNGGPAGDAIIEISVLPHAFFTREGQDIFMPLPVSVREAVLGAKVTVPTPAGTVAMTLKPHSDSGTELRLRGRGVPAHGTAPAGDLYVSLRVVIGPVDEKLEAFLKAYEQTGYDARAGLVPGGRT